VFTNLLLADEINRTPPKTQAALLEAMQEGPGERRWHRAPLPDPFIVVATQNPIEYEARIRSPKRSSTRFLREDRRRISQPADGAAVLPAPAHAGVAPATLTDVQAVSVAC
jgi:MoxR-like ATPase